DGDIERAPCALDDPAYANIKVTITAAQFNNLQGLAPDELRPAYAAFLGQSRPISTICTIRDAAATILRRKGYLAAVQVPTQRIENGVVKFELLFARVVAVRVRGDAGNSEKILAGYLGKLTADKIFNRFSAERYLLLARDLPGMEVRLSLKPAGTAPGELVGEVSVVRTPFEADLNIQDYAAHGTGRWSGMLRGQAYGLLGQGDRLSLSTSSTADIKEQQIVQLGYDMKLGHEGLALGGNLTYAWTQPDLGLAATPGMPVPKLTARTLFATLDASYPVIRSQAFSTVATVGMDFLNQSVKFNGIEFTRDHLRVAFARLDFDATDVSETHPAKWRASGSLEFRRGLNILDASHGGLTGSVFQSRSQGNPQSSLIRFAGQFEYNLGGSIWPRFLPRAIAVAPRAQYAFDPLLGFEQFSAGSYSIGRGYDPGTISGDNAVGATVELRWNRVAPFAKINLSVQPFLFEDIAWTWLNQPSALDIPHDRIISVGGGFHAALNNRFRLDGTVAVPLRTAGLQTTRQRPRFLVSFTTKL
ncbi:MAG: ShlB/FhaC/HecB family hemolysin secretion/activation protein, partial [Sphingomonas sp.]|nr:ShlB/FhaC/HecB family hemolysin secretion/activation protein [Sphingomonas sp.]